jgi:hypothetical protein
MGMVVGLLGSRQSMTIWLWDFISQEWRKLGSRHETRKLDCGLDKRWLFCAHVITECLPHVKHDVQHNLGIIWHNPAKTLWGRGLLVLLIHGWEIWASKKVSHFICGPTTSEWQSRDSNPSCLGLETCTLISQLIDPDANRITHLYTAQRGHSLCKCNHMHMEKN